ncbi:alpha-E domain-containing protein [Methylophaga sp. OBS3]|uniref:alpha-E domain-containing protein n=1 Tax=Methylophaga sp. OBS3 TaxID=2991934 RepID=UPI00224F0AD5|nr:alpha-E domain-containing protein [Methylophaga sp. OBS3]MCX4189640.1 alpha-E domain-containing protein [Methylophaga sp. OBS3]
MLSRVAERVYWLARYLERVENTARLINVHTALLMDLPREAEIDWFTLISIFDADMFYHAGYEQITEQNVMHFLLADTDNPMALIHSLRSLRENARTSLDILPEETWEQVNELYLLVKEEFSALSNRRRRQNLLVAIMERCQTIWGIFTNHMSRNNAYYFLQTAKHLERADMTSRILEMASLLLKENRSDSVRAYDGLLWTHLLRALSAQQMYTRVNGSTVSASPVLGYLIRDTAFPRSLFFSLSAIGRYLSPLPNADKLLATQKEILHTVLDTNHNEVPAEAIHRQMDALQIALGNLNNQIGNQWFYPDHSLA